KTITLATHTLHDLRAVYADLVCVHAELPGRVNSMSGFGSGYQQLGRHAPDPGTGSSVGSGFYQYSAFASAGYCLESSHAGGARANDGDVSFYRVQRVRHGVKALSIRIRTRCNPGARAASTTVWGCPVTHNP